MGRRNTRGNRRDLSASASVPTQFARLFTQGAAGDYRFEASSYTTSAANAASFVDLVSGTRTLAQATGANQALIPTANAAFNNQRTAAFSGTMWYDSSESAATWNFLHNGASATQVCVFRPTSALAFGTLGTTIRSQDAATNFGSIMGYRTSGTNGQFWRVCNGSFPRPVEQDLGVPAVVSGTATYFMFSYGTAASPQYVMQLKSATTASGAQAAAPVATNASNTLRLGANGQTNDLGFVGDWAATYIFKRVLNATERSTVQRYIHQRYGLAP